MRWGSSTLRADLAGAGRPAPAVLKFGGYALRYPGTIAARIVRAARGGPILVVASAREGVTDLLESAIRSAEPPSAEGLVRLLRQLHPGGSVAVRAELARAHRLLLRSGRRKESAARWAERVRSVGERLAVRWLAHELDRRGIPAIGLDADRIGLRVTGPAERARILVLPSQRAVRASLDRVWRGGRIPILTGYFGRSTAGCVGTVGRNGSDYTATAVAQMLGASRVELVKPSAFLRPGPGPAGTVRPSLLHLSYDRAEAIARSGTSAIHPATIGPARSSRIPILIRPLRASKGPGILIGDPRKRTDEAASDRTEPSPVPRSAAGGRGEPVAPAPG
jgi:bifunctional aspartokinase / homoserine dehydrogenase 1